jgi:hypothetical protein
MQVPRCHVAKPPANPISHHCLTDATAHDESNHRRLIGVRPHSKVPDNQGPAEPLPATNRGREVRTPPHPRGRGQHRRPPSPRRHGAGQTLTRARPLRRRAARMARPARVRMRSLNPCVLARRRLFGWNVRLLTETPDTRHRSSAPTIRRHHHGVTNRWDKVSAHARTILGQRRITGGVQSQTSERYAHNRVQSNLWGPREPNGAAPPGPTSDPARNTAS